MKIGKLSEPMLRRSVLRRISYKNPDVFTGAGLGRDFASMNIQEDEEVILSTDTVTCGFHNIALYGINKTANNIAASGGIIKGVMLSVIMPGNTGEAEVNGLMRDISAVCKSRQIQIIGGHTETVNFVNRMVVTFTGVGVRKKSVNISVDNIKPGMDIVMSGEIALEGTAILAHEREDSFLERFNKRFIDMAKQADKCLSVEREAAVAVKFGVQAMHDVSRGGIFGALWELGAASGCGVEVSLDKISLRQETVELCEYLGLNPYNMASGGALLMVTTDGEGLAEALTEQGIGAEVIGRITDSNDRVIIKGEDRRYLEPPKSDDIIKGALLDERKNIRAD